MERRFQSATERLAHIAVGPTFNYNHYQEPELFLRFVIPRTISKRIYLCDDATISDNENDIRYQPEVDRKPYLTTSFIAQSAIVTRATRVCNLYENDLVKGIGDNKGLPMVEESNRASLIHDQPHRTCRRTVFKDRYNTLYLLTDYAEYALAMVQIIQAGYVHQNISPGNCLYTKDSSDVIQIKIADLEYARLYSTEFLDTAPLTGTPGFMAVETECRQHLCTPRSNNPPPEPFIYRGGKSTYRGPTVRTKATAPKWFRYNFLHDVESALWLFCWFLFNRLPSSIFGKVSPAQCQSIAKVARKLFNGTSHDPISTRTPFIGGFSTYSEVYELLNSIYEQDTQYGLTILDSLIAFRSIGRFYTEVESSTPIPTPNSFMWSPEEFKPAYYGELQGIFYRMSGLLNDSKLSAMPIFSAR